MTISHHLDHATILRYASGDLDESFAVVVASHIAMCPHCRAAVRAAEQMGGELLDADQTADLSAGALDRMMDALDGADVEVAAPVARPDFGAADGDVPAPLRRFVGPRLGGIAWKSVAPGIRRCSIDLPSEPDSQLYLLHIAPGKAMPEHGHGGAEMTLILSGAYSDDFGRFGPGDVADLDEHVEHQPFVELDEPCICVIATEKKAKFKKLVPRLFQPIVGI